MVFRITLFGSILLIALSKWGWQDYQNSLKAPAISGNTVLFEINKGDSFNKTIDKLLKQNVNINPFWFNVYAVQTKAFNKLKVGEYELSPGLSIPEILTQLVQGKTKQHTITFPEGWSFKEILKEVENNPNIDHSIKSISIERLLTQLEYNTTSQKQASNDTNLELYPKSISSPEGLLFPDTYFFEKHTLDITLLKRAYDKMQLVINQEWQHKAENLPFKTPYEALILASIVEKETAQISERPLIAGIFIRRLQAGMLLQTDPTVIYGMGEGYQGNISYNDLKTATPYNTYQIKGLPPTPIAMPGRDAINATLHPDTSANLYFVARGDGTHQFSATLKDHNMAVDNFQRKKNDPR